MLNRLSHRRTSACKTLARIRTGTPSTLPSDECYDGRRPTACRPSLAISPAPIRRVPRPRPVRMSGQDCCARAAAASRTPVHMLSRRRLAGVCGPRSARSRTTTRYLLASSPDPPVGRCRCELPSAVGSPREDSRDLVGETGSTSRTHWPPAALDTRRIRRAPLNDRRAAPLLARRRGCSGGSDDRTKTAPERRRSRSSPSRAVP